MESWKLALVSLVLVGCSASPEAKLGQSEAVALVWRELGARSEPPPIYWIDAPDPQCTLPDGQQRRAFRAADGECHGGFFDGHAIALMWNGSYASSALAHELIHAWMLQDMQLEDGDHTRPEWKRVPELNAMLRD